MIVYDCFSFHFWAGTGYGGLDSWLSSSLCDSGANRWYRYIYTLVLVCLMLVDVLRYILVFVLLMVVVDHDGLEESTLFGYGILSDQN